MEIGKNITTHMGGYLNGEEWLSQKAQEVNSPVDVQLAVDILKMKFYRVGRPLCRSFRLYLADRRYLRLHFGAGTQRSCRRCKIAASAKSSAE